MMVRGRVIPPPIRTMVGGSIFGAFRRLVVPEEKIDPFDVGEDLGLRQDDARCRARPEKQRWFAILDHYWLETRLLEVASPTSQYGTDWYYVVDKAAKSALRPYIKDVVVLPCYLFEAKVWSIWVVKVGDTKWWSEVEPLFRKTPEFYRDYAFRVISDRANGLYRIKHALISELQPCLSHASPCHSTPVRTVGELLADSLGESRFIESMNHQWSQLTMVTTSLSP